MPERPTPIYSTCEEDPDLREEISDFVIALAENVDLLQDTEGEGNLSALAERSKALGTRAAELGYAPLQQIAAQVSRACEDGKSEDAQAALVELTDVARLIRQGHRGAAG